MRRLKGNHALAIRRLGLGLFLVVGIAGERTLVAKQAHAMPPESSEGQGSCVLEGTAHVVRDTPVFDKSEQGSVIAELSGALAPLKITRLPHDAKTGRVLLNGGDGFRVEGFAQASSFSVFSHQDLAVVPGHIWISSGTPLKLLGEQNGRIQVELPARSGFVQPTTTEAACGAFTLTRSSRPVYDVPKGSRGYVSKNSKLDLYTASGTQVHALQIAGGGDGVLLWGKEQKNGMVHVTMRSELYVDAWVKLRDVRALPKGELMDQVAPPPLPTPPGIALKQYTQALRAPKETPLRADYGAMAATIGTLEQGAEVYVVELAGGWATVLPKQLHILPPAEKAFWVSAADLGLQPGAPVTK